MRPWPLPLPRFSSEIWSPRLSSVILESDTREGGAGGGLGGGALGGAACGADGLSATLPPKWVTRASRPPLKPWLTAFSRHWPSL